MRGLDPRIHVETRADGGLDRRVELVPGMAVGRTRGPGDDIWKKLRRADFQFRCAAVPP